MNIYKIAKKEIIFNFKNYWIFLSAFIFFLLNILIIYFGEAVSGDYSQTDVRSLSLSIIHLQMYLIPLLSFILSYDSILSEKEAGTLDLILSYRITLLDVFLGKLLGNIFIFTVSFLLGFLPISIYLIFLGLKIIILIKFILLSIWLSFVFNSFALYISNLSRDRTFVILLSILIWLFFVFIYDVIFIFLTIFLHGLFSTNFFNLLLFLNPTEIFRLSSIINFMPNDANELFGINFGLLNMISINFSILFWLFFCILIFIFISFKKK